MNLDVAILCGGQGTRIRHLLPEGTPKALVQIGNQPLLDIIVTHLIATLGQDQFPSFVLCTGYGRDRIRDWLDGPYSFNDPCLKDRAGLKISHEAEPLGTGGALLNAKWYLTTDHFFTINGDTVCGLDYNRIVLSHLEHNAVATIVIDPHYVYVGTALFSQRIFPYLKRRMPPFGLEDILWDLGCDHAEVNWITTDAPYYDIGTPEGLETYRRLVANGGKP